MVEQNYIRNTHFVEKQVGDELILVPLTDQVANMSEVYTLNEVGAFIWNCLENPLNLDQLVDKVTETFDVSNHTAAYDVNLFINQSLAKNLVILV
jgi:hypothetical protein